MVSHAGDVSGFSALVLRAPTAEDLVVLLSNQEGLMYYDIAQNVLRVLHGHAPIEPKAYLADFLREAILSAGLARSLEAYGKIRASGLEHYNTDEGELIELGHDLLAVAKADEAVEVFRITVGIHNGSPGAHRALGEALYASGDLEGAAASYRTALTLDPGDESAAAMLEQIAAETHR